MDNFSPLTPEEKPNWVALMLAALVHLLLIGALFLGVQWKSQAPSSVAVEVWRAPPPSVAMKAEPVPEPPAPPEPKPEPKPVPKAEPTPPVKPDIAIKDDKKKKEEPKKPEPKKEEPRKPEPKKEEAKKPESRREVPDFKKQLEQDLKDAERQKAAAQAAQDHRALADAELKQLGQTRGNQAAAARKAGEDKYRAALSGKIRGNIVLPPSIKGNPEAVFKITQLPSGEIIDVKIIKSSGNKALDEAIERAIRKSDPLPLPEQPELFQRVLELKYKPFDE